jgi:peptide/nickel transport system permease protein
VARFLATRVLEMAVVLLGISIVAFLLLQLVPGDPASIILGIRATPERLETLHRQLGLDRPLTEQYWSFISGAVHFDFGDSIKFHESVGTIIGRRLEPSLLLIGYSLLVSLAIAVPMATIAAVRRSSWVDQVVRLGSTASFTVPPFWMALLLITVFSLQLGIFPTSGYGESFPEHLQSLTLPAVTMSLALAPLLLRQLRAAMVDTMQSEYVEAARARGLAESRVLGGYVVRNSAISTVTLVGLWAGVLISATVVIENIFTIPGLGSLLVQAVQTRDYPVIQALTLLFGAFVVVVSLLTDLAYSMLDPRVRL